MHILIIGYVWPEPASSAGGRKMIELMDCFTQQGWKISFASPASKTEHMSDLASMHIDSYAIQPNDSDFDQWVNRLAPDIVVFDRFMMEEQFGWRVEQQCPDAMRILETVDLHCLRHARQVALKQNRKVEPEDLISEQAAREVASILRCDLSLMISEVEIDLLVNTYKVDPSLLMFLPFMLDPVSEQQQVSWSEYKDRKHFMTIGNFVHAPNRDAVEYLKSTIWPLIRAQIKDAQLHVYGSYANQHILQLNNEKQGFYIKGRADDAEQTMMKYKVCLAPLRFGAGIKGKLIESMVTGTPSVTTSCGAESMAADDSWNGFVEDDAQLFSNAAVTLYQDEDRWKQAQVEGINIIKQRYNKTILCKKLVTTINEIRARLSQHRLENFTGLMLRHHTMKSTHYMSRWIEAKNKHI